MPSISESAEHQKIHEVKENLTENARRLFNEDFPGNFREHPDLRRIVRKDIKNAWDDPRMFVVEKVHEHISGTVGRLLTNSPTRGERRKIREMAEVSNNIMKSKVVLKKSRRIQEALLMLEI